MFMGATPDTAKEVLSPFEAIVAPVAYTLLADSEKIIVGIAFTASVLVSWCFHLKIRVNHPLLLNFRLLDLVL